MARKKEPPKPIASLRFDFAESLENVCHQAIMMIQAISAILQHDSEMAAASRDILKERHDALRDALIGKDE